MHAACRACAVEASTQLSGTAAGNPTMGTVELLDCSGMIIKAVHLCQRSVTWATLGSATCLARGLNLMGRGAHKQPACCTGRA